MKKMIIAIAMLALLSGCAQEQQQAPANAVPVAVELQVYTEASDELLYEKQFTAWRGESLFDTMRRNGVPFEYEEFSFGVMVTGIGGQTPGPNQYIAIYVDGDYSDRGVKDITLEKGASVDFRIEGIAPPA